MRSARSGYIYCGLRLRLLIRVPDGSRPRAPRDSKALRRSTFCERGERALAVAWLLALPRTNAHDRVPASIHQSLVPGWNLAGLRRRARRVLRILKHGARSRSPGFVCKDRGVSVAHVRIRPISHLARRSNRTPVTAWFTSIGRLIIHSMIGGNNELTCRLRHAMVRHRPGRRNDCSRRDTGN